MNVSAQQLLYLRTMITCGGNAAFGRVNDIYVLQNKGLLIIYIEDANLLRCRITESGRDICLKSASA